MTELPKEIESTYLELAAVKERARVKRSRVRSLELQITLEACSAKDEAGKPILKNEREREAAIATMLAEFKEVATELSGDESDETHLMARLERLRMEFKVEMLESEQRNALALMKAADAWYTARHNLHVPPEIELPF